MHLEFLTKPFLIKNHDITKPIIVTGAGGCIGSWIMSILYRSKIPCVGFDVSDNKERLKLIIGDQINEVFWENINITEYDKLLVKVKKYDPTAIIHLAGLQVPFCANDPALGARVNVEGTINIFEAAKNTNLKRIVYASSVAALGLPPGGNWKETFYGVYKQANEHTAYVYSSDYKLSSIGIRPNIVYGLTRDQGISSKNTTAIHASALNQPYEIPYSGEYSWLYAGEAASAFIFSVLKDFNKPYVFNLNGPCETLEKGIEILKSLNPISNIRCNGSNFPFPPNLSDEPIRKVIGNFPSYTIKKGIKDTYDAFLKLNEKGFCTEIKNKN